MDKSTLSHFVFKAAAEIFATMLGLQVIHGEPSSGSPETVAASDCVVAHSFCTRNVGEQWIAMQLKVET